MIGTGTGAALVAHTAATLAMAGLIWFVQLVHYPLFDHAARQTFARFAHEHQRRTTWIVLPLMAVELVTASLLLVWLPDRWTWTGAALLALVWLSTAFVQVPLHRRLGDGFDPTAVRALVATNWLRTVAWSGRAVIALYLMTTHGGN